MPPKLPNRKRDRPNRNKNSNDAGPSKPRGFPLFRLPFLVFQDCLWNMELSELVRISICSKKATHSVKAAMRSQTIGNNCKVELTLGTVSRSNMKIESGSETFELRFPDRNLADYFVKISNILTGLVHHFQYLAVRSQNNEDQITKILDCFDKYENLVKAPSFDYAGTEIEPDKMLDIFNTAGKCKKLYMFIAGTLGFEYEIKDDTRILAISGAGQEADELLRQHNLWNYEADAIDISGPLATKENLTYFLKRWDLSSQTVNFKAPIGNCDISRLIHNVPHTKNNEKFVHPKFGEINESLLLKRNDAQSKKAYVFKAREGRRHALVMYIVSA